MKNFKMYYLVFFAGIVLCQNVFPQQENKKLFPLLELSKNDILDIESDEEFSIYDENGNPVYFKISQEEKDWLYKGA